ncbi:Cadherin-8 [Varanus komodoensis]|nr:Cadherin-8 [Varanus komodoensis]
MHCYKMGNIWFNNTASEKDLGIVVDHKLHTDLDPGSSNIKYILSGDGAGTIFVINDKTGDIHAMKRLDREEKAEYTLTAQAVDRDTNKPLEPPSEFIIKVQDINDNPPEFVDGPYHATVPEMSIVELASKAKETDDKPGSGCLHIKPKRHPQGNKAVMKKINVSELKNLNTAAALAEDLDNQLSGLQLEENAEKDRKRFRDFVHSSALKVLGPSHRKQQDWFDENSEEIKALLAEKPCLHHAHQNDPLSTAKKNVFNNAHRTVQSKLRKMQDSWLSAKADEIQKFADRNDAKRFCEALRSLYGPQPSGSSPLLDSDGATLITEKTLILQRWAEHFQSVLNRPSSINNEAIDRMPQVDINHSLDASQSKPETLQAISQLSSGKAPGSDAIPAEVYKEGGAVLVNKLTQLFQSFWNQGSIPQELKDASIMHLYKRKEH